MAAQESDRVVRVVHALLEAQREAGIPVTAGEVCVYDDGALTVRSTGAALREAARRGLAAFTGRYWLATNEAMDRRREFEDRALAQIDAGE
jgi:hypothetical protein